MPLPNSEKFEKLLASFSVNKPASSDSWREFVAIPKEQVNEDGTRGELPPLTFWYREESDLTLEKVLKKIAGCLQEERHDAQLEIAATVAAIFAHTAKRECSAVERFNQVFAHVVSSDLNQFVLVRDLHLPSYRFRVGPFSIGPFQRDRLAYQSQKSGSDFFIRYEHVLSKMPFSVERSFRPAKVVFWHRLTGLGPLDLPKPAPWHPRSDTSAKAMVRAITHYFKQVSSFHFKRFFEELREVQEIPMALGSGWFDLPGLWELLGSQQISVFLNIGGEGVGFVAPIFNFEGNVNLGGGHLGIPFTEEYLLKQFHFVGPTDCEIHQSLKSYCHFVALGVNHCSDGRAAEGLLHHVIALDMLFGERLASTASVSTRCAALTCQALGYEYSALVKEVQKIYDARSKYVHQGRPPDQGMIDLLQKLCRETAFCLFRLQRDEENRKTGFHLRWLKEIDLLVAIFETKRTLPPDELRRLGVWTHGEDRYADFDHQLELPPNQFIQGGAK